MSITTKQGDNGETRLYSGETVNKRSRRIIVCGDIDELVSFLGVAKYNLDHLYYDRLHTLTKYCNTNFHEAHKNLLCELYKDIYFKISEIQTDLFTIASEIATVDTSKLEIRVNEIFINRLENNRKTIEAKVELPKGFILPGNDSCYIDLARSVARRVEREIVGLYNESLISNKDILIWMNRLSDYLYLLARYLDGKNYDLVKEMQGKYD